METKNLKKLIILGVSVLIICIAVPTCVVQCTKVDTAEAGIKFNKLALNSQGSLDATSCAGFVFYNPITTDVYTYPTYVQRVDYKAFTVTTKDAASFSMDPLLAYQIDRSKAINIFAKYRRPLDDIQAGYMRTCIYDAYRITANKYTSDSLMASRAKFEDEVRMMLDKTLGNEGFIVTEFTSEITPPQSLTEMIDAKNRAVQAALKAENEVKEAEANAKIAVAKAEGDARAMKIKADAEAYYNRTIAASLSPMIVQEDWIEKWDGHTPTIVGQGNTMFDMSKFAIK